MLKYMFPFVYPVECASIGAGASGIKTVTFDGKYTFYKMLSAIRGQAPTHGDFRIEIKVGNTNYQSKPFSIRALVKDGEGFDFVKELGAPLFVDSDEQIEIKVYNDSAGAIVPSLQFVGERKYAGKSLIKKQNYQKFPMVYIIEPDATIATGGNSGLLSLNFDGDFTILRVNTGCRATAAAAGHTDFRCEIFLPEGDQRNPIDIPFSARALSLNNVGFDFTEILGKPLEVSRNDKIQAKLYNESGADLWPSLIFVGFLGKFEPEELKKYIGFRLSKGILEKDKQK